ncbi:MAG: ATP-binding cassette domain-containing protein [Bacteroidales bacterium]|nr:ATP-binding cassette domain-containing protein [Bacteroidales bacterium]
MSVRVENLTKLYGENKAVDNISFNINSGEVVGFLGPNGAGKSTTMKIITGCIASDSGEVFINGVNIKDDMTALKKSIGYLPENNPLYLNMYVKEYLEYSAGMYLQKNEIKNAVEKAVEAVGLGEHQFKKIGELSKGYKQRTGIARAMVHNPSILILDEPTTGLDPNQIVEIRNLIKDLGKEKTVILSTHIMQEAEAVCDRAIIINKGKIVADDTLKNLKAPKSSNSITVEFGFDGSFNGNFEEIVKKFAEEKGLSVLSITQSKGNLENIFRELTLE